MKADDLLKGDIDAQRERIAHLQAEAPPFLSGSVAERLAALPQAARAGRQAPDAAFDAALSVLLDEGFEPPKRALKLARKGDLRALTRVADDARQFHLDRGLNAPPTIMAACDVLGALATFLTVDREAPGQTRESYDAWMSRRDAALYAFAAAEVTFQEVAVGIVDLAGERLEGKSRARAAGSRSGAVRRKRSARDQARTAFTAARAKNHHLTASGFAKRHHEKYGRTSRTVQSWLKGL